jgi:DNA-nicking Smr family endonuclease
MSGVRPLKSGSDRRDTAAPSRSDATPQTRAARAAAARAGSAGRSTAPSRSGTRDVRKSDFKALQRGRIRVDATVDLHGLTAEAARPRLQRFLDDALVEGLRCVRIVHGKGLRSGAAGPVLKTLVQATLSSTDGIGAYTDASPADGGSGATVVLLLESRRRPR